MADATLAFALTSWLCVGRHALECDIVLAFALRGLDSVCWEDQ